MEKSRKQFVLGAITGALAAILLVLVLVLVVAVAVAVAYGGAYDIAASRGHTAGMRWFMDTTMHSSIRSRAGDADAQRVAGADLDAGASEYKSMCEHCHGGPGVDPAGWSRGMLPQPPHLVEEARDWEPAEVVWIVRHGIKYTGMPAFGDGHREETLWDIAAFVKALPGMTPVEYRARGHAPADPDDPSATHDHSH